MVGHPLLRRVRIRSSLSCLGLAALTACGGGGGGGDSPGFSASLLPSATYAQQCAPGNWYASTSAGSLTSEKRWIRSYFNEAYLWADEVPAIDPNAALYMGSNPVAALANYFDDLKVTSKDRFSFMYPTAWWEQLSQSGVEAGYGIGWTQLSDTPPRGIRIAYVQPGSPAATAGLQRGDTLVSADGASADTTPDTTADDTRRRAMYPSASGQPHSFVFSRAGSGTVSANLNSANVTMTPVPMSKVIDTADGAKVGYLVFNDHIATAEAQLITAIRDMKTAGVSDLVLDLRYNGGGYLYIASELAYMIAGSARTSGKVFEQLSYNAKRVSDNNNSDARTPFYSNSCILDANFNCTLVESLPTLNLSRVYVLTTENTCSASEAVINGLRGVDVDVRLIGGTTCGKPYGFTAKDNCGISYFPIEFKGVNAKGFGDYASGFVPAGTGSTGVTGCQASDDLSKALGDASEGMLSMALGYRRLGTCTPAVSREQPMALAGSGKLQRSELRSNRFLVPKRP